VGWSGMGRLIATMLLAELVSSPAFAWESLDNENKNLQCAFSQAFDVPGETTMVVSQNQNQFEDNDQVGVIFFNQNWSLAPGDKIDAAIGFGTRDYEVRQDNPVAVTQGFGLTVPHDHLRDFADTVPRAVYVMKGEQVIARLDFTGFSDAWSKFEICHDRKVAARSDRELPRDPFAKGQAGR
jgi:hypothetical protein